MIITNTKTNTHIHFGFGSVGCRYAVSDDGLGIMSCMSFPEGEIGRALAEDDLFDPNDADVNIVFHNLESLDNVIRQLNILREYMQQHPVTEIEEQEKKDEI